MDDIVVSKMESLFDSLSEEDQEIIRIFQHIVETNKTTTEFSILQSVKLYVQAALWKREGWRLVFRNEKTGEIKNPFVYPSDMGKA